LRLSSAGIQTTEDEIRVRAGGEDMPTALWRRAFEDYATLDHL
jgi:hypothetical protein